MANHEVENTLYEPNQVAMNPIKLGCVSFLNAKPLIDGFDFPFASVMCDVPSGLLDRLQNHEIDMGLCPVIDFQLSKAPLQLIPVGAICCDGPTYTVRVFSRVPIRQISSIALDTHSHTSLRLLKIILHEVYQRNLDKIQFVPLSENAQTDAKLLIGDKVVTHPPAQDEYRHQLDLGTAWKNLTGLPFVFAIWMMRQSHFEKMNPQELAGLDQLIQYMDQLKSHNLASLDQLIARHASDMGWPEVLAHTYLGQWLHYDIQEKHLKAMHAYYQYASELGLISELRDVWQATYMLKKTLAG